MKILPYITVTAALLTAAFSQADEEYNHFPAIESATTSEALCHLFQYNQKLTDLVSKDEMSAQDMVKVHELTYTLENALARLTQSLKTTAENLETVHKASERLDIDVVKNTGRVYLDATAELLASCIDPK